MLVLYGKRMASYSVICRLCLAEKNPLLPLFQDDIHEVVSLSAKIANFAPLLKPYSGDGLPAQVCHQCVRLVNTSYKFKQQCESSDAILRQFINSQTLPNNVDAVLHSVFRNEPVEQCWKLEDVKNEFTVEDDLHESDISIHEDSEDYQKFDSGGDFATASKNDFWMESSAGPSSEEKSTKPAHQKKKGPTAGRKKVLATKKKGHAPQKKNLSNDKSPNGKVLNVLKAECEVTLDVGSEIDYTKPQRPPKDRKTFLCHDCGKNFARKQHLLLHLRTHTGEKPFACKVCGESFGMSSNLNKHMRIHTGERPFLCTVCGKRFGRSDTLTKHMRCHTGEKPFHCTVCGNNFGRSSTLINHMRTHLGEKPYLCTECGRRFVQSYDLTKHMRSHTGEKPFRCTMCHMSFGQKNSLNKHMRNHTGHEIQFSSMNFQKEMQYKQFM